MKRGVLYGLSELAIALALFAVPAATSAQMMSTQDATVALSADEQAGKNLYSQLQDKQLTCAQLTDDNFDNLGDFFMARMMGSSHEAMDQYMSNHLGETNDRAVHVAMGKRLSGCNVNAAYPTSSTNYAPLAWMGMMGTNVSGWNMMNGWGNSAWSGTDIFLAVLLLVALAAIIVLWMRRPSASHLDLLKRRYAKGEITKAEFEQQRKDLR